MLVICFPNVLLSVLLLVCRCRRLLLSRLLVHLVMHDDVGFFAAADTEKANDN